MTHYVTPLNKKENQKSSSMEIIYIQKNIYDVFLKTSAKKQNKRNTN